jgi:hypothetical protein
VDPYFNFSILFQKAQLEDDWKDEDRMFLDVASFESETKQRQQATRRAAFETWMHLFPGDVSQLPVAALDIDEMWLGPLVKD